MPSDTRFWHPFADMHAVRHAELEIARGEGVWVWDADDNRYLDGTASLWCVNAGHGRREIVEAVTRQMDVLATYQCFGAFSNAPVHELAERLRALAPLDDPRVFLGSGGGDAIDTAAKLARRYFAAIGCPERVHLISRTQGDHCTHGLGTSIGGIPANLAGGGAVLAARWHVVPPRPGLRRSPGVGGGGAGEHRHPRAPGAARARAR